MIGVTGIVIHLSATGVSQVQGRSPGSDLVIAEVYGGGSAASGLFSHDYVVLFNRGTSSVKLADLFLQSADPADDFHAATNVTRLPDVTLEPGQYFLVSLSNVGMGCRCPNLPTADHVDPSVLIRADNAKVALVRAPLDACGSAGDACPLDRVVDLVGYGRATQWEGNDATGADALTSANALRRKGNGCTDSDRNFVDFDRVAPQPRNSRSPKTPCNALRWPN